MSSENKRTGSRYCRSQATGQKTQKQQSLTLRYIFGRRLQMKTKPAELQTEISGMENQTWVLVSLPTTDTCENLISYWHSIWHCLHHLNICSRQSVEKTTLSLRVQLSAVCMREADRLMAPLCLSFPWYRVSRCVGWTQPSSWPSLAILLPQ